MSFVERATLCLLNVDLDVESTDDLRGLIEALEPHAYSLERPPGHASFELDQPGSRKDPEALILEFTRIVKSLPPAARKLWDGAAKRVFDIGLQSGRHPFRISYEIGTEALREVADIRADIAVTMYAVDPLDTTSSRDDSSQVES